MSDTEDTNGHFFAEADSSEDDAKFVILGVPTDQTACHRKGANMAPDAIREESYNFESYLMEYDIDLEEVPIADAGNIGVDGQGKGLEVEVADRVGEIVKKGAVPILLGGEHSITPPAAVASRAHCAVVIDAHLDYRKQYLDDPFSHACTTYRLARQFGNTNVMVIGVRSMSAGEARYLKDAPIEMIKSYRVRDTDPVALAKEVRKWVDGRWVYLSVDMDGIDPSFAPGVGTPEPFGMDPLCAVQIMENISSTMVGMDVVEVFPPHDNGNTSALAARMVRSALACMWKNRRW